MKARIRFSKAGSMKFIGHLDLMRFFQKAFRRCGLDICYSKGFHPHQIMSFASPLGVGLTSDGEYLDMELNSMSAAEEMIKQMNQAMNGEIMVRDFFILPDDAKSAMSLVAEADYLASLRAGYPEPEKFQDAFGDFLSQNAICIVKKTKKSSKEIDIKPMIKAFAFTEKEFKEKKGTVPKESVAPVCKNGCRVYLKLAAGSEENLKPDLVLKSFYEYLKLPYEEFAFSFHRLELYQKGEAGELISLGGSSL